MYIAYKCIRIVARDMQYESCYVMCRPLYVEVIVDKHFSVYLYDCIDLNIYKEFHMSLSISITSSLALQSLQLASS